MNVKLIAALVRVLMSCCCFSDLNCMHSGSGQVLVGVAVRGQSMVDVSAGYQNMV
jgi:hypothetical protein